MTAKAFLSYAHFDDLNDNLAISKLAQRLAGEIRAQSGQHIQILQDRSDIQLGERWKSRLREMIDASSMFIAVVTPNYLRSEVCCWEFDYFVQHQNCLGHDDLVLPVYYISCKEIEGEEVSANAVINRLLACQRVDFRDLRGRTLTSYAAKARIAELARRMLELAARGRCLSSSGMHSSSTAAPVDSRSIETDAKNESSTMQLADLSQEAKMCFGKCRKCEPIINTPVWDSVRHSDWYHEHASSGVLPRTTEFFGLIEEYSKLPRARGKGYLIEDWVRKRHMDAKLAEAIQELSRIEQKRR